MAVSLKARWIVPVGSPPIESGVVTVENGRISFVGTSRENLLPTIDLGESVLLPGLVNAHGHLEHSTLKEKTTTGRSFTEWVKEVAKKHPEQTTQAAITQLIAGGTTTLADHCSPETDFFDTPLRRIIFWEVLGSERTRAKASLKKAIAMAEQYGGHVSPHSLYGVHQDTIENILRRVARGEVAGPVLSVHLCESTDEVQFFRHGAGPMADYVKERGGTVPFGDTSPVRWLNQHRALSPRTLLIHGNYLTEDEMTLIARSGATVVHCPGSHRFFGHQRFPLEKLRKHGIPIALGTDSLASNKELSLLREMRLLKETQSDLVAEEILKMGTIKGARALGLENEIGSIAAGKKADLIAIPIPSGCDDPYDAVLRAKEVSFSMVGGTPLLERERGRG